MRNFLLVLIAVILAPFTYGLSLLLLFGLRGKPKPITQTVIVGDQEKTGAIPTSHRMSPASLVAEATASRAIPRSKHGLDLA